MWEDEPAYYNPQTDRNTPRGLLSYEPAVRRVLLLAASLTVMLLVSAIPLSSLSRRSSPVASTEGRAVHT